MNAEDRNREKKSHLCVCVGVSVAGRGKKSSAQIGAHDVKPSEIAYALLSCFTSPPTFFLSLSSGSGFLFIWAIENAQRPTTTENHHQQQQKQEEEKEKMKLMFGSTFPFSSFLSPFRNKTTYTHTHQKNASKTESFFSFSPMLCHGPLFIFHKPNIFTGTHTHTSARCCAQIYILYFFSTFFRTRLRLSEAMCALEWVRCKRVYADCRAQKSKIIACMWANRKIERESHVKYTAYVHACINDAFVFMKLSFFSVGLEHSGIAK